MAELKFNDNGTISLSIEAETYTLKRPTVGQLMDFWDLVDSITAEAQATLKDWMEKLKELPEDSEEYQQLIDEINHRGRHSYEHLTWPWLRQAFNELGSAPLPEDLSRGPSELIDPSLPSQILSFWRTVPLAHSGRRRN